MSTPKRPRDLSQRAKLIVDLATGEAEELAEPDTKDPAAVARGRKGGAAGGRSRAKSLSAEERKEIAKKGAEKRWKKGE